MALKADSSGFLIGETIDIGRAVDQLRQVRADVAAIKRALIPALAKSDATRQARTTSPNVAEPISRAESSRQSRAAVAVAEAVSSRKSSIARTPLAKAVEPKGRDSKGRFTTGSNIGGGDGAPRSSTGWARGVAGRLVAAVQESGYFCSCRPTLFSPAPNIGGGLLFQYRNKTA